MKRVLDFLRLLSENNDRDWFMANRSMYLESESAFNSFAEGIIEGIGAFDSSVGNLTVRDCTYRIYRDVRFSSDKSPYKTWKGVFVCPHGKKSGYPGYYVHVDPISGCFMCAGLHMPDKDVLQSVREEVIDNGEAILDAVLNADGFSLCHDGSLKRNPKGFPEMGKLDELLRLRDEFLIMSSLEEGDLLSPDCVDVIVDRLRRTKPFNDILLKATMYVKEQ